MQLLTVRYLPYARFGHSGHADNLAESGQRARRLDHKQKEALVLYASQYDQAANERDGREDQPDKEGAVTGAQGANKYADSQNAGHKV